MPNNLQRVVVVAVIGCGLMGCKAGPQWDWWRLGKSGTPDSSPIARSAGPPLPSELAQQGESSQFAGNTQMPLVDSGGNAPAYEQDMTYSGTPGLAGNTYPSTPSPPSGYANMGSTPTRGAGSDAANLAGDPFARSRGGVNDTAGVGVQRGPYDPNGYAAASTPPRTITPPTTSEAGRYGSGAAQYGGSEIAVSSAPHAGRSPLGAGSSRHSEGVAAAGYQQPSPIHTSPAPGYSPAYSSTPSSEIAVSPRNYAGAVGNAPAYGGGSGRYGEAGAAGMESAAGSVPTAPTYGSPSYDAPTAQAPQSVAAQPYRPAGTSDYTGPGESSPISIAGRQEDDAAPTGQATSSTPVPAPGGRYGLPAGGSIGSEPGRRY